MFLAFILRWDTLYMASSKNGTDIGTPKSVNMNNVHKALPYMKF